MPMKPAIFVPCTTTTLRQNSTAATRDKSAGRNRGAVHTQERLPEYVGFWFYDNVFGQVKEKFSGKQIFNGEMVILEQNRLNTNEKLRKKPGKIVQKKKP